MYEKCITIRLLKPRNEVFRHADHASFNANDGLSKARTF